VILPFVGKINIPLAGSALALVGFGLYALWVHDQGGTCTCTFYDSARKQAVWAGVAAALMLVVMLVHYRHSRPAAYGLYGAAVAALGLLLVFGKYTRGARGWFALGPVNVQPAELAKIAVVLALARWLSGMSGRDLQRAGGLVAPAAIAVLPMGLILVQPDLGNAMLFVPVLGAMLFVAGARMKHLAIALAVMLAAAPFAYRFGLKEYQRNRLTSFLWPERVPRELSYQQTQSERACASGGAWGSESNGYYVPDRHTDFIASLVAEETGFVGASFLLLFFAIFFAQAVWIAAQTRDPYGRLVVVGLVVFLAMQVFVNVGMATGVAPITGLTLPFVSYGGSSLVACFLALGLILNVSSRWAPGFSERDIDAGHHSIRDLPTKLLAS
jgi:rod shape determining protein RodA